MRINHVAYVLLLAATGCEKTDPLFCKMNPGASGCPMPDGDVVADMEDAIDAPPDIAPRLCYGAGSYAFCLATTAQDPLIFMSPGTIDTSTSNTACRPIPIDWTNNQQPDACFIVATVVSIPNGVTVSGSRPLVLVSASTITIGGTFDAAGHRVNTKAGPGVGTGCTTGTLPVGNSDGGGGGAGGSFMGDGRNGGDGNSQGNGVAAIGETQAPVRLRAGCSGQAGATGQGASGGTGGPGGGGVYMIAAGEIILAEGAIINLAGGGGGVSGREAGGGGGGSGGMLVLAAPLFTAQGTGAFISALGGAGSSGAAEPPTDNVGAAGGEHDPTMPLVAALGGDGPGGDGGDGATGTDPAQVGADAGVNKGGGGGGGSRGYIQSNQSLTGIVTAPMVTVIADP